LNGHSYTIADLPFAVAASGCFDIPGLLPSFASFRTARDAEPAFTFTLTPEPEAVPKERTLLEENEGDIGTVRLSETEGGYFLELVPEGASRPCTMSADPLFTAVRAGVPADEPEASAAVTSMLRIVFAQSILLHGGTSIHASAVVAGMKAYLFLGPSGTGKSTHARLWLRNIPSSRLLNDDNPVIRLRDGVLRAYGTPWSGKTPCYRNESYPVAGIVRLHKAAVNEYSRKDDIDAFVTLLPSCSVVRASVALSSRLYDLLGEVAGLVAVGELDCTPDDAAAMLCYKRLSNLL